MCLLFINYSFYFFYCIICVRYKHKVLHCIMANGIMPQVSHCYHWIINSNLMHNKKIIDFLTFFREKLSQKTIIELLGLMLFIV